MYQLDLQGGVKSSFCSFDVTCKWKSARKCQILSSGEENTGQKKVNLNVKTKVFSYRMLYLYQHYLFYKAPIVPLINQSWDQLVWFMKVPVHYS